MGGNKNRAHKTLGEPKKGGNKNRANKTPGEQTQGGNKHRANKTPGEQTQGGNTNRANKTPDEQKPDDVEDDESVDVGKDPDSDDGAHIKFISGSAH